MAESIGIIGGGIVGIAMARALSTRGLADVTVLEKEQRVAMHQTGHNSGVVHAGLYYAPASLKARLCQRGRVSTRDYCRERDLPYRELGKLVVALTDDELPGACHHPAASILGGCRRTGQEHWRMGAKEIAASLVKPLYFRQASGSSLSCRWMTSRRRLPPASGPSVVPDGSLLDDFAIEKMGPVTLLRNAPSPAATSAMAIAEHLL